MIKFVGSEVVQKQKIMSLVVDTQVYRCVYSSIRGMKTVSHLRVKAYESTTGDANFWLMQHFWLIPIIRFSYFYTTIK